MQLAREMFSLAPFEWALFTVPGSASSASLVWRILGAICDRPRNTQGEIKNVY